MHYNQHPATYNLFYQYRYIINNSFSLTVYVHMEKKKLISHFIKPFFTKPLIDFMQYEKY